MKTVDVSFPAPRPFDCHGQPMTTGSAAKVLEEAAELVEAVKDFENLLGCPGCSDDGSFWKSQARVHVIDEAMDVYQALSNYSGRKFAIEIYRVPAYKMCKHTALRVLQRAAWLFADQDRQHTVRRVRADALEVLKALALFIGTEFTEDQIASAYDRCVRRNELRGRYEDRHSK